MTLLAPTNETLMTLSARPTMSVLTWTRGSIMLRRMSIDPVVAGSYLRVISRQVSMEVPATTVLNEESCNGVSADTFAFNGVLQKIVAVLSPADGI